MEVASMDESMSARAGSTIDVTFRARPDSSCQLDLRYTNGEHAERLMPALADESGLVSWRWQTDDNASGRIAQAYVVCSGGQRGEAKIEII
jgi:hypothetical protein